MGWLRGGGSGGGRGVDMEYGHTSTSVIIRLGKRAVCASFVDLVP